MWVGARAWPTALEAVGQVGQITLAIGTVLLPWSDNAIGGSSSVAEAGVGTALITVFVLAVGVSLLLQPYAASRFGRRRRVARLAGIGCSLAAVLAAVSCVIIIGGSTVRAYGVDPAGRTVEPEAQSHPGTGLWCALALCLIALAFHAVPLLTRRRS